MQNWSARTTSLILSFNTLVFASTQILLFTLLPYFAENFFLPLPWIVASFTMGSALFLWGSPFWTAKSDTLGRQKIMNIGLLGLMVSFALIVALIFLAKNFSQNTNLFILVLSRIIYGALASAIVPVAQAMRSDLSQGNELKSMFTHSLGLSLGRTIGPLLLLISPLKVETLLSALTILMVALLGINLISKNKVQENLKESTLDSNSWIHSAKEIFWPLLITVLFTSFTGILHSSLGGTLQSTFDLNPLAASKLMAEVLLGGSLTMILIQVFGKSLKSLRWQKTLLSGVFFLLVGTLILLFMNQKFQIWPAIIFISAGIALVQPSNLTFLHETHHGKNLGQKVGLLSSGNTVGYAVGGVLTSIFLGFNISFISCCVVIALLIASLISCRRFQYANH